MSRVVISCRRGTPTWLSTRRGAGSFGRSAFVRAIIETALRRLPSSGVDTTTTSSAAMTRRSTQGDPDMRDVEHDVAHMALRDLDDAVDRVLVDVAAALEARCRAEQRQMLARVGR